jgi:hypothetical protein
VASGIWAVERASANTAYPFGSSKLREKPREIPVCLAVYNRLPAWHTSGRRRSEAMAKATKNPG